MPGSPSDGCLHVLGGERDYYSQGDARIGVDSTVLPVVGHGPGGSDESVGREQ
jgi:hypothetical protein